MKINICNGIIKYLYNEEINLDSLGDKNIKRASFVEPSGNNWYVNFNPLDINIIVEGFKTRSEALLYEKKYIETNIL